MRQPDRVVVAGDWHGNLPWATGVVLSLPTLLPGEKHPTIVHCGDFGIWPGQAGRRYVHGLHQALRAVDGYLWFVDGNHEDHDLLAGLRRDADGRGLVTDRILWLPRGHRWRWHDRTWLGLGGAVSLDRVARTAGKDWWPAEEITNDQATKAKCGGPVDAMVTHDCPAAVEHQFPDRPSWWSRGDLARNDKHRRYLQRIVNTVQPTTLMHGHLHRAYSRTVDMPFGPVDVTGFDCDGQPGNYAVLDVRTLTWVDDNPFRVAL